MIAATPAPARRNDDGAGTGKPREYPRDLGASLALAVGKGALKPGSAESALHLLTRQRYRSVVRQLPALTALILKAQIGIDWARLTDDLAWWSFSRDRIATRWLEHYYDAAPGPDGKTANTSSDNTDQ